MILQGRNVGGGTTVNWTSSFRTPERDAARCGPSATASRGLDAADAGAALRRRRGAPGRRRRQPRRRQRATTASCWDGAAQAGLEARADPPQRQGLRAPRLLRHGLPARRQAVGAARRTWPTRSPPAPTSTPTAACKLVETDRGRARAVVAEVLDRADRSPARPAGRPRAPAGVVLAGGAINTPALLLRSKAGTGSGVVGKRTFLHPTVPLVAFYDQPVEAFYGAPQSVSRPPLRRSRRRASATSSRRRPCTRCWARSPSRASATATASWPSACPTCRRPSRCSSTATTTTRAATVAVNGDGRIRLRYPLHASPARGGRWTPSRNMARLQLAAGAREVMTLHETPLVIRSEADIAPHRRRAVRPQPPHDVLGPPDGRLPDGRATRAARW